jgi:hypothetical protein
MEQVLKRLGIDVKVYLRLWDVLSNDIQSFVQSHSTSSIVTKEDFLLRASAIKGAVSSLGAVGLMNLFAALEKAESVRSPDALSILKAIDEEHVRVLAELAGVAQSARKT